MHEHNGTGHTNDVAIIGMSGRFPRAASIDELWRNLCDGVQCFTTFSDDEVRAAGVAEDVLRDPDLVKGGNIIDGIELFDAAFFGFQPREAETLDPQHRLFLECAWEALEGAGYDTARYEGSIGLFGGCALSSYVLENLLPRLLSLRSARDHLGVVLTMIGNDKDPLTSRVAHVLDLRGPAVTVQSYCSTSLVAVHLAAQALLGRECDMALAGGASIRVPQRAGYLYQDQGIFPPDGLCRAFDARGRGACLGDAVGVVLLKRLSDAVADGDHVHAVIKGSAVNNDGARRAGYAAPGVLGQARVIAEALAVAGVGPDAIGYVEAHGTGTALGDPIEVAAMTKAFRLGTQRTHFCPIGSLKTNMGHLDIAAGVSGLIKASLCLERELIPPSLNFERPNPEIDFESGPFFVNTALTPWRRGDRPRRAGVNSFGLGGTNAHVVLEEAPPREPSGASRPHQLLLLSARTAPALENATDDLVAFLTAHPEVPLPDVAHTLRIGRRAFEHRRALVCRDGRDAIDALAHRAPTRLLDGERSGGERPLVFLFPGLGDHYVGMGRGLYEREPAFRAALDRCAADLAPHLGLDVRDVLLRTETPTAPARSGDLRSMLARDRTAATDGLTETWLAQPAVFAVEWALTELWAAWGVTPRAMLGFSLGEYVAATVAGVLSLEDALALVARRARLIHELPPGAMLAVALAEDALRPLLAEGVALSAVLAPELTVVAGPPEAVAALERRLDADDAAWRRLPTTHAFHSPMMEPIVERFEALLRGIRFAPPRVPYVSNLTGTWITEAEATSPRYWTRHLCEPVRLDAGFTMLWSEPGALALEVGPGQALGNAARQHPQGPDGAAVLASLRPAHDERDDEAWLLETAARLWIAGVPIDWRPLDAGERRHRVPLPTYPFERKRYWVEAEGITAPVRSSAKRPQPADWLYLPSWRRLPASPPRLAPAGRHWLLFEDGCGLGAHLTERLRERGDRVTRVQPGPCFARAGDDAYALGTAREDYGLLAAALARDDQPPEGIVHCWGVEPGDTVLDEAAFAHVQERGFYSVLFLAQALAAQGLVHPMRHTILTTGVHDVVGGDAVHPARATVLGAALVLPQEYLNVTCQSIDLAPTAVEPGGRELAGAQVLAELLGEDPAPTVACRGAHRWARTFEPWGPEPAADGPAPVRPNGVYLVSGGLGGVGMLVAGHLARTAGARLVLVGRTGLPPRAAWSDWIAHHGPADAVSRRIRGVQELESCGAEVEVLAADVGDPLQARAVVAHAVSRFGTLHGVVHAAGLTGFASAALLPEIDRDHCEGHLRGKSRGALALAAALAGAGVQPDFCLLCSSLSSVLGGLGYAAYAAANYFLDAFAQHHATGTTRWIAVNWDTWRLGGDAMSYGGMGKSIADLVMEPAEALEVFQRILAAPPAPQVVVSTGDLEARLTEWVALQRARDGDGTATTAHPRPDMVTPYVPPSTELERWLVETWQEVLGVERVGIHDSFFELGGHSLLVIQLLNRLRRRHRVELPVRRLVGAPTVATLAAALEEALATAAPPDAGVERSVAEAIA